MALPVVVLLSLAVFANGQFTGDIRLNSFGFTSVSSGRLEIYYFGSWGTVCNDGFFLTDADVACRQLGFSSASSYGTVGSEGFSQGTGSIWLDQVTCSGSESRLVDCSHNSIGSHDCFHSQDIAVTCVGTGPSNGDIRLNSYGTTSGVSSGRVEIYYNGEWGTVCDDSFFQTDADVACRQLGYSGANSYNDVGSLGFSQGTDSIWLDDVTCSGTESRLVDCSRNRIGSHNCGHHEDVAVRCGSGTVTIAAGVGTGVSIAVVVIVVVIIVVCVCCCISANKRTTNPRVRVVRPNAATVAAPAVTTTTYMTTTQPQGTAYPMQSQAPYPDQSGYAAPSGQYTSAYPSAYPSTPQQPPAAYPTGQPPYPSTQVQSGEDQKPELYPDAPPAYGPAMNQYSGQYPAQDPGYAVPQQQPQPQYY